MMTRLATIRARQCATYCLAFLLWSLPVLIGLKIIQVTSETGARNLGTLRLGVERRINDPSFYAVMASGIAGWLVVAAQGSAPRRGSRFARRWWTRLLAILVWFALFCLLAKVYVDYCRDARETWYDQSTNAAVWTIQRFEGMVILLVLFHSTYFFPAAITLACNLKRIACKITRADQVKGLQRAAGLLMSIVFAGLIPIGIAFVVSNVFGLPIDTFGDRSTTPRALAQKLLMSMMLYYSPFALASLICCVLLWPRFRIFGGGPPWSLLLRYPYRFFFVPLSLVAPRVAGWLEGLSESGIWRVIEFLVGYTLVPVVLSLFLGSLPTLMLLTVPWDPVPPRQTHCP